MLYSVGQNGFGGLAPRVAASLLGPGMAQTAENCDLRSGALRAIAMSGPIRALHDGTSLVSQYPVSELGREVDKPAAPQADTFERLAKNIPTWLDVYGYCFVTHTNDQGYVAVDQVVGEKLVWADGSAAVDYSDQGFVGHLRFVTLGSLTISADTQYRVFGPIFAFKVNASAGNGGPAATSYLPFGWRPAYTEYGGTMTEVQFMNYLASLRTRGPIPGGAIALTRFGRRYGELEAIDAGSLDWTETISSVIDKTFIPAGSDVEITFRLNYAGQHATHRDYLFAQTTVDGDGREGPASTLSDLIHVSPGQVLKLKGLVSGGRLYRSVSSVGFARVTDLTAAMWTDEGDALDGTALAPGENWSDVAPAGTTEADFFEGAGVTPDGWGFGWVGNKLYKTDVAREEGPRLWAWVASWTEEWPDGETILAAVVVGNNIVVLTTDSSGGGTVYAVNGSNPAALGHYRLTGDMPLLNKLGLARIGDSLYWPTKDGLATCGGGSVSNVTKELAGRAEWSAWDPATMKAWTAEQSIFLQNGAGVGVRVDLDGGRATLSTWTGSIGGTPWTASFGATALWKSAVIRSDRKERVDLVRAVFTGGALNLKGYADGAGTAAFDKSLTSNRFYLSGTSTQGSQWEFLATKTGAGEVRMIEGREAAEVLVPGKEIALSLGQVEAWELFYLQLQHKDTPVAAVLKRSGTSGQPVLAMMPKGASVATVNNLDKTGMSRLTGLGPADRIACQLYLAGDTAAGPMGENAFQELIVYFRRPVSVGGRGVGRTLAGGLPPWWIERYEVVGGAAALKSLWIDAPTTVTYRIWLNGKAETETPDVTGAIDAGAGPARLTSPGVASFTIDFSGSDHLVRGWELAFSNEATIGAGPFRTAGRQGLFRFPDRGTLAGVSVTAGAFTTDSALTTKRDGTTEYSETLATVGKYFRPFPMANQAEGAQWEVDLDALPADDVQEARVWPLRRENAGPTIDIKADDTGVPPWLVTALETRKPTDWVSGRVDADSYPVTLRIFKDGALTGPVTTAIASRAEFTVAGVEAVQAVRMDFNGDDSKVNRLQLFSREEVAVGKGGLIIRRGQGRLSYSNMSLISPEPWVPAVARIVCSNYNSVRLLLNRDGVNVANESVASRLAFRLDAELMPARRWDTILQAGTAEVYEFCIVGRRTVFLRNGAAEFGVREDEEPVSLLALRVQAQKVMRPRDVMVRASAYPVLVELWHGSRKVLRRLVLDERPVPAMENGKPLRAELDFEMDLIPQVDGAMIYQAVVRT